MKTLTSLAVAAIAASAMLTSCGKGQPADAAADTLPSQAFNDSLSQAYGSMVGSIFCGELLTYQQSTGEQYDRQEFYKGIMSVVGQKHPDAYLAGVSSGLRMMGDIQFAQQQGASIDRAVLMKALANYLMSDTITSEETSTFQAEYTRLLEQIVKAKRERERIAKEQDPKAVMAVKTGQAVIEKLKKENPNFKVTPEGLGYIIENPGEGAKIQAGSHVVLNYTGKHLDGKVFDQNTNSQMIPAGTIPGFSQGVQMLAKGGKATFYIPGALAYGADGNPQAGIAPMEMLVFDVEVVDVQEPNAQDAAAQATQVQQQ